MAHGCRRKLAREKEDNSLSGGRSKEEKRSLVGRLGHCSLEREREREREREVGKIKQATVGDSSH
jgi:hypothetical protein